MVYIFSVSDTGILGKDSPVPMSLTEKIYLTIIPRERVGYEMIDSTPITEDNNFTERN